MNKGKSIINQASAEVAKLRDQQMMLPDMIKKLESTQSALAAQLDSRRPRVEAERKWELNLTTLVGGVLASWLIWMITYPALTSVRLLTHAGTILVTAACYLPPAVMFYAGFRLTGVKRVVTMVTGFAIFAAVALRLSADVAQVAKPQELREESSFLYGIIILACETLGVLMLEQLWMVLPAVWRRFRFERLRNRAFKVERELAVCRSTLQGLPNLLNAANDELRSIQEYYAAVDGLTA